MGDGTADGAGEGETGVEGDAGQLLRVELSLGGLLERIELFATGRGRWCCRRAAHCVGVVCGVKGLLGRR